jgi:hypothetical protein
MGQAIVEFLLDDRRWLFSSILLSAVAVVVSLSGRRGHGLPDRLEILWAMNVFYGCMIGTMSLGHLTAVTVKAVQGTLEGSLWILYPLGLALTIPAWWLAVRAERYVKREDRYGKRIVALNSWLGVCLVGFGLHNLPLAAPAALNIGYQFHRKRAVGWTIVTVAIATNVALFVGSIVFLASGQSFEQFQGMK